MAKHLLRPTAGKGFEQRHRLDRGGCPAVGNGQFQFQDPVVVSHNQNGAVRAQVDFAEDIRGYKPKNPRKLNAKQPLIFSHLNYLYRNEYRPLRDVFP